MTKLLLELISIIFPVIFIVGIGYLWNNFGNSLNQKEIVKIIAYICAPCLVFDSLIKIESSFLEIQSIVLAAIFMIFGMLFYSYIILKIFKLNFKTYANPITFVNSGNLGISLCLFAFGKIGLEISILYFAISSIFNFTLGVAIWSGNWSPKILFKTPILFAVLAVIVLSTLDISVPRMFDNTISLLGGATIPLLLFSMGVSLANIKFDINIKVIILIVLRTLFALILSYLITNILDIDGINQKVILLQSVLPAALFNYLFASKYTDSGAKIANYIMLSTLISVFTISLFFLIIL